MNKNPYKILGINENSSIEEIKKSFKKIALECHPDKTLNEPQNIRDEMNNRFKEAAEAYKILLNNENYNYYDSFDDYGFDYGFNTYNDWMNMFSEFITTNNDAKDYVTNIAKIFRDHNIIKNKKFYKFTNIPLIHKITLNVTYKELINNEKKKLQLLLKDINDPIYIKLNVLDSFPNTTKIYIDDDDIQHDIDIKIKIIKQKKFRHKLDNNKINIYYKLKYNLYDYLNGYITKIKYINDEYLDINIPQFVSKQYEIKDKGINGGSLIIKIKFNNTDINVNYWNKLDNNEKDKFNKLLFGIFTPLKV